MIEDANSRAKAQAFLLGSDRARNGKLIEDLENDYLQGTNNYPKTVVTAYNLLTDWKQENRYGWGRTPTADGVAFATEGRKSAAKKHVNVTCHKCGVKGHYATDCPELAAQKAQGAQKATTLLMAGIDEGEFDSDADANFTFVNHKRNFSVNGENVARTRECVV